VLSGAENRGQGFECTTASRNQQRFQHQYRAAMPICLLLLLLLPLRFRGQPAGSVRGQAQAPASGSTMGATE